MNFQKFKTIMKYNQKHQEEITSMVRDLYLQTNMDYERGLLNVMQVVRPLLEKKQYILLEIPFKDREIGAICYRGDSFGYTFLNSALPTVNVNFALCHEIYHILYQKQPFKQKVELYMNEHFYEYEDEMAANCFAGVLLMPENAFISLFRKFVLEKTEEDTDTTTIMKLMNYFEAPYMAVLIRCYELNLFEGGDRLRKLLEVTTDDIREEFLRLWLNEEILLPTKKDDFSKLEYLVKKMGERYIEEELLNDRTVSKVLDNMRKIYKEIRG